MLVALAITLVLWLFLTLFLASSTTIENANRVSYNCLKNMQTELQSQLEVIHQRLKSAGAQPEYIKIAQKTVEDALSNVTDMFGRRGLLWVSAEGYIAAWQEVHVAENAMVLLLPGETVILNAQYDRSRLQSSTIPNCSDRLNRVQQAIDTLISLTKNGIKPSAPKQTELEARLDLSQIRSEINQYSDDRWAKLVRYRKNLMVTAALTGAFTYVLLCIPILLKADLQTIIAATVIYIVGATVGLFSRLNREWNDNKTMVDSYGLTQARVLVSPLLSGLAAVGGVLLVSILGLTLLNFSGSGGASSGGTGAAPPPVAVSTVTASGITVQVSITQQTTSPQDFPTLGKIFNLEKNLTVALVVAAVFGFLPNLLINVLQQQANNWQSQIQSNSQASQGSNANSGSDDSGSGSSDSSSNSSAANDGAG